MSENKGIETLDGLEFTSEGADLESLPEYGARSRKWLGFVGAVQVKIKNIFVAGVSDKGNKKVQLDFVTFGESGDDGRELSCELNKQLPVTGVNKRKEPNWWQLLQYEESVQSVSQGADKARKLAAALAKSPSVDAKTLCANLIDQVVYLRIGCESYLHAATSTTAYASRVIGPITKQEYDNLGPARRQALPPEATLWYENLRNQAAPASSGGDGAETVEVSHVAASAPASGAPPSPASFLTRK